MQYYYLIAGLTEVPFDIDGVVSGAVRVDVPEIKGQIMAELSTDDRRAVELLYTFYDIENIVGYIRGTKLPFNVLGNLSQADVALLVDRTVGGTGEDMGVLLPEEMAEREQELAVPGEVRLVVDRFKGRQADGTALEPEEFAPLSADDLERELFQSFYRACGGRLSLLGGGTVPEFLRRWAQEDRMVRNIVAAYKGRKLGLAPELRETMIVEERPEVREALVVGQAQDFGLRDEFPYMEPLLQVLETEDFVEREKKMDALRAEMADALAEHDYFGIGKVMDYLIRLNILHRWAALDPARGREDFRALVAGLTDADRITRAVEG